MIKRLYPLIIWRHFGPDNTVLVLQTYRYAWGEVTLVK